MEVIVAPHIDNLYDFPNITVFLAGGITNCHDWQSEVIEYLRLYDINNKLNLKVFNPRRPDFNIEVDDPVEQIRWEYDMINNRTDIFSMYFCNSESDQPICMYELGMRLGRITEHPYRFTTEYESYNTIISVEDGYKRANDVLIQTELAVSRNIKVNLHANPKNHADLIIKEYEKIMKRRKNDRNRISVKVDDIVLDRE